MECVFDMLRMKSPEKKNQMLKEGARKTFAIVAKGKKLRSCFPPFPPSAGRIGLPQNPSYDLKKK